MRLTMTVTATMLKSAIQVGKHDDVTDTILNNANTFTVSFTENVYRIEFFRN